MDYHKNLQNLTPQQYWLLEHQITAFWHGFGISNGLYISESDLERGTYHDGKKWMRVKPERMQKELHGYIKWLENYKARWHNDGCPANLKMFKDGLDSLTANEKPERLEILRMISLLQNNKEV